ncbi:MAG: hypothetical protein H0W01_15310 [Pseudonocardiales bacterium]|nr:hypothetical protein [Pseudonocardiales bacterium]
MFEPVGPLPAAVYWRRRWTALIATVAAVVVMSLAVSAMVSTTQSVQAVNDRTAPLAAESNWQFAGSSTAPATPSAAVPSPAMPPAAPAPAPEASEQIRPDAAASAVAVPPGIPAAAAPTPPPTDIICADRALVVMAQVDRSTYRVGEKPVFRLVVTNTGPTPCKRDLDAALQEVFVVAVAGTKRTWSSNDCFPGRSTDVRVLAPNAPVVFAVTWSGLRSAIGCKTPRKAAPAGAYGVQTRLGALMSAPVAFELTAPQRPTG